MNFALKKFPEVPRIDQPNKGDQKSSKEEHDSFLLDNAELLLVDIVMRDSLNHNGHHCSCKEKPQRVLKHEAEL